MVNIFIHLKINFIQKYLQTQLFTIIYNNKNIKKQQKPKTKKK